MGFEGAEKSGVTADVCWLDERAFAKKTSKKTSPK
jgi:hypothetical protein